MTLSEVYTKPLKEVLEELDLVYIDIHANDDGFVKDIELRYAEAKEEKGAGDDFRKPPFIYRGGQNG